MNILKFMVFAVAGCLPVRGPYILLLLGLALTSPAGAAPPAPKAWAEVIPFSPKLEPAVEFLGPGKDTFTFEQAGPAILCFGGEGWATACSEQYLETGTKVAPVLERGVFITGQLVSGGEAVAGDTVAVFLAESPPTDFSCFLQPLAVLEGCVLTDGEPVAGAAISLEPGR